MNELISMVLSHLACGTLLQQLQEANARLREETEDCSSILPLLINVVVFHLLCEHPKFIPTTGPLHVLFPLPGMLFPKMFTLLR